MSDGLSAANRANDYTRDPVDGSCNNCGYLTCDCAVARIAQLEKQVRDVLQSLASTDTERMRAQSALARAEAMLSEAIRVAVAASNDAERALREAGLL